MNDLIELLKNWKTIVTALAVIVGILFVASMAGNIRLRDIPRDDYAFVAESFIRKSNYIANKLGKVNILSHVGKGGSTGSVSYNVFRVQGEETTGVCTITLTKNANNEWFVTEADLSLEGKTFRIPVKRSEGEKWRFFKME